MTPTPGVYLSRREAEVLLRICRRAGPEDLDELEALEALEALALHVQALKARQGTP